MSSKEKIGIFGILITYTLIFYFLSGVGTYLSHSLNEQTRQLEYRTWDEYNLLLDVTGIQHEGIQDQFARYKNDKESAIKQMQSGRLNAVDFVNYGFYLVTLLTCFFVYQFKISNKIKISFYAYLSISALCFFIFPRII